MGTGTRTSCLGVPDDALDRPFSTLSPGEQTKALLAALFLNEGRFLLIDEPTNHLDTEARRRVAAYLKRKRGSFWSPTTGSSWTAAWTTSWR